MAFEVFLMPTTASPASAQVEVEVRKAIPAEGGALDADGAGARAADGIRFTVGDGGAFGIDQLSPGLCRIIFRAALRTNSVVVRGGADATPLKMKGAKGAIRGFRVRADPIASPQSLCVRLDRDLVAWNRFMSAEQAEGAMDRNQEPLEPPGSPRTEPRLSSDPSGVVAQCLASANPLTTKAGWTIERTVVSQNPQYGVVWRADVVTRDHPNIPSRVICWRLSGERAGGKVMFEVRPLQMFDPSQSVGPLEAKPTPNGASK